MSILVVDAVLAARISPPTKKLAAVALANRCNDEGGSLHPSMALIAKELCVSRSQAQRIVRSLISDGLLSVVANANGGKPGATPHYQLHVDRIRALALTGRTGATGSVDATGGTGATGSTDAVGTGSTHATGRTGATGSTDAAEGSHGCTGGVAPMHKRGRTGATLTVIEPSMNRQEPARAVRASLRPKVDIEHPLFAEFYAAYPRKVDPEEAAKAFAKVNPDRDLLTVMLRAIEAQGLAQRCAAGEGRFVAYPATWLNKKRWSLQGEGTEPSGGTGIDRNPKPAWLDGTGFADVFEAENAGCGAGNAAKYRNGERVEA
jgi:hypothetical protein